MTRTFVLGCDVGTSAVKVALFDAEGRIAAHAERAYPLLIPEPGWAEQSPDDWWNALCAAVKDVMKAAAAEPGQIAAIGIAAQMCGVVPVDREGTPLANGILWLDMRSSAIARRLVGGLMNIRGYGIVRLLQWLRLTGGAPSILGKDPPSKMLWLREARKDLWPRVHKLLDVKDYLVHRCTGNFVTSYDCAHLTWLLDSRHQRKSWSPALLKRTGIDAAMLPDIAPSTASAGGLTAPAAVELGLAEGTPVSVGLGDVSAAALASGTPGHYAPHLCVGTSNWLGAMLPRSRVNPLTAIGSISSADGKDYLLIATQECAGACVGWALGVLGLPPRDFAAFDALASSARPSLDAPLFMPWFYGERAPVDDQNIRGGFLNISVGTSRGDLAHAVYEGVALNVRYAMGDFDRLAEAKGKPLRLVGGGGNSAVWCRIFADVLQRPIEVVEHPSLGGARGCAMTAAVTAGWYADLHAASAMVKRVTRYDPDTGMAALYATRYARFVASCRALKPWYAQSVAASGVA